MAQQVGFAAKSMPLGLLEEPRNSAELYIISCKRHGHRGSHTYQNCSREKMSRAVDKPYLVSQQYPNQSQNNADCTWTLKVVRSKSSRNALPYYRLLQRPLHPGSKNPVFFMTASRKRAASAPLSFRPTPSSTDPCKQHAVLAHDASRVRKTPDLSVLLATTCTSLLPNEAVCAMVWCSGFCHVPGDCLMRI